jgi:hypothetical protein
MIIVDAKKTNEVYGPKLKPHRSNNFWDYLSVKIDGKVFRMVFEHNSAYCASYIRQWSIDDVVETNVEDKFVEGTLVPFDASCGLLGKRLFEHNSITWEFLYKQIPITWEQLCEFKKQKKMFDFQMGCHSFIKLLETYKIPFEILFKGSY